MATPTLLLSPDGSRDTSGSVTPNTAGSVSTTAGQYGTAWNLTGGHLTTTTAGRVTKDAGTVLLRIDGGDGGLFSARETAPQLLAFVYLNNIVQWVGSTSRQSGLAVTPNTPHVVAVRWQDGTGGQAFLDGTAGTLWDEGALGVVEATLYIGLSGATGAYSGLIESVLVYDAWLPDAEIARISALETAWTWDNAQPPASGRVLTVLKLGASHRIGPLKVG